MRNKIIKYVGSPKIFTFAIMWLIVLVFTGTIMQKYDGLYIVQNEYFSNWIKWFGFLPLPSAKFTMSIMFINLSSYFLRSNIWHFKKLGVTITHLGFILLLFGSALTYIFSYEGSMIIKEGDTSDFIENSYKNEFVVSIDSDESDSILFISFPNDYLFKGNILKHELIPFDIEIYDYYVNCIVRKRESPDDSYKGFLVDFSIDTAGVEIEKEYEKNKPGIYYKLIINSDSSYSSHDLWGMPLKHSLESNTRSVNYIDNNTESTRYDFYLRRERTDVPFAIELVEFNKANHPGTNTAKSYSSDVLLKTDNKEFDRLQYISMNAPLRYAGYTLYQASFYDDNTTVLAVVKNYGRIFPYIACIIMSIGILFHLFNMVYKRFKRKNNNV